MLKRLLTVTFLIVALAGFAGTSLAQYVYLDANGDGVSSTADRMNANGVATTVAVWVNTNHNRNGSLATCVTADGDLGTWNSYAVDLGATNGTVTFAAPTNNQAAFTIASTPVLSNATEMTYGNATGTPQAGGLQKMFTVTITGVSGTPSIGFLPFGLLGPDPTSFGTPCSGNDFDNTYKLSTDFTDNDGLGP